MTVGSYQTSTKTLWFFVIDLPPGDDGKRRQHKRRGFATAIAAEKAETEARNAYGEAAIGAEAALPPNFPAGWRSASSTSKRPLWTTTATCSGCT
jgi:hypothetical protein